MVQPKRRFDPSVVDQDADAVQGEEISALEELPTLAVSQSADLKCEADGFRVWLSRTHEGEVVLEVRLDHRWVEVWRGQEISERAESGE